jgi:hypothetical protein
MTDTGPTDRPLPAAATRNSVQHGDQEELLEGTGIAGRALYRLVRCLLDDFEEAAPWSLLYAPPADPAELRRQLSRLLELVERAPARVTEEIGRIAAAGGDEHQALAEAEFYFVTLHRMTAPDQRQLVRALLELPDGGVLPRARADFLGELAADLKGKYSSAVMGAAAALVSDGRWLGVDIETRLFPEKAQEWERNRHLLGALGRAVESLRELGTGFAWRSVLASWQQHRSIDRYALGALVSLRVRLLRLLSVENRRALYSGDYHQLQRREGLLGERLRELEELHLYSLELPSDPTAPVGELFDRLQRLLLEIAALLDVELLRRLIGSEQVGRLRSGDASTGAEVPAGLALLLAEEDLRTFLDLLVGAVGKRSSVLHEVGEALVVAPAAPAEQPREAPRVDTDAALRIDARKSGEEVEKLVSVLAHLTRPASGSWRSFQMVYKLQARLGSLPPALFAESRPFLAEIDVDLLPLLDRASSAGTVPRGAVDTLRACRQRLDGDGATDPATAGKAGADLGRIVRLLDSLRAAFGGFDNGP